MTADHPTREERRRWCLCSRADRMNDRARPKCPLHGDSAVSTAYRDGLADAALVAADPAPDLERLAVIRERWTTDPTGRYSEATERRDYEDVRYLLSLVAADPAPAQPDAALSDEERPTERLAWAWTYAALWGHTQHRSRCKCPEDGEGEDDPRCLRHRRYQIASMTTTVLDALDPVLAARAAQPGVATEVSRGVAEVKAEALREAADAADRSAVTGLEQVRPDRVAKWLRDRADRLVRDALGGERGDGA